MGKKYYRWRIEFGQTSKKEKQQPQNFGFVLILLCAVSLLGWKIWTSDEVQMRFVYMWPYQGEILEYSGKKQD
ncbi:hypothetical protein [Phascolarctobacterium faecium]|uniref:hypothetical protein n=1 Tax=Phascolarctobacterium faecium TaxID=33025 RepID=UPI00352011D3